MVVRKLNADGDLLEVWTSCGLMVKFNASGEAVDGGRADSYDCPDDLGILKWQFASEG